MMSKPPAKHRNIVKSVPTGIDLYEYWRFGFGRDYAPPEPKGASRYLTALAEWKPGGKPGRKLPTGAKRTTIWLPTLWKPDLPQDEHTEKSANKHFTPHFVPFILKRPARQTKADTPATLRDRLLAGITEPNIRRFLESIDLKKLRFRVGLPVKADAMRKHTKLERSPPDWKPDPEVRRRLANNHEEKQKEQRLAKQTRTKNGKKQHITIFAIIDDGLPFAHRNFRDKTGKRTRVEFCWLQSAEADESAPESVLFGREYTRRQIETAIASHGDDEDSLYRTLGAFGETEGLASLLRRHTAHGAHVMDLATGYAAEHKEEPDEAIRIIGVQLPNLLTMDTSGVGKDMYLLSAFHYIFDRADRIARGYSADAWARLVINFSYGYFGGSHDGEVDAEAAIHELIEKRRELRGPTALVLPAGNSFLDRMHARIPEAKFVKDEARLQWRLQPADRTPNYVELWFPPGFDPTGYNVAMRDPSGAPRGSLDIETRARAAQRRKGRPGKNLAALIFDQNRRVGIISADHHREHRWRVLIVTAPSEPPRSDRRGITPGVWTIVITRNDSAQPLPQAIHCWIQRDTDPENLRSGARQSYFDDPLDVRFNDDGSPREQDTADALVQRFGSLNGLATHDTSVVVAGFRLGAGLGSAARDVRPVRYSCAGPHNEELPGATVDCASMSDRAMALPGTVAAGVRSGSRSILNGTSVAAPVVARQLATIFVSASDAEVAQAEPYNYLPLLRGAPPPPGRKLTDRLGEIVIGPYRQPGLGDRVLPRRTPV